MDPAIGNEAEAARSFDRWAAEALGRLDIVVVPPTPVATNVAEDERLTRSAAADGRSTLRLWWAMDPTVVIGYSEKRERVADLAACERLGVPVIRRSSGGGTVLQMPGVLNYSLTTPAPAMLHIRQVFGLGARLLAGALSRFGLVAHHRGISDVAIGDRKISGNAMAKRWGGLLLHGTLLCDLDLSLVEACLSHPPREPDYRRGRSHRDFLTTLREQRIEATERQVEEAMIASARELPVR